MDITEVGNRIRDLRIKKGWTQNRLANEAGVSPTYIYQLENGQKSPTVEYLNHVCFGLGVTLKEFFGEENEKEDLTDVFSSLTPKQKQLLIEFLKTIK